jgi:predicted nucleic acid-binding protein
VRVLVDTSVWSLALRRNVPEDHPQVKLLAGLIRGGEDVFLTGSILQEVLQAFRAEATFRRMVRYFDPFPLLPMDRAIHVAAATLHRTCARHGVAASTVDCEIAAAAIQHRCALLTADKDFERMARYCDLVLA